MPAPGDLRAPLGRFGETYAAHQLGRRGYQVLERNVRLPSGEIDIIANESGELVFVEVKTRRPSPIAAPEESITDERMAHLEAAIAEYLSNQPGQPYRIEIVAIEVNDSGRVVRFEVMPDVGLR